MTITDVVWFNVGIACMVVTIYLLNFAWRMRQHDVLWRWFTRKPTPAVPPPLPPCCRVGVDDISKTTITGSWTCPSCGRFHTFIDGKPGKFDQ